MPARFALLLAASAMVAACQADPAPGTWQRGTAKACDSCTSDLDCAAGLLCDQDSFACKSVEQLKKQELAKDGAPVCEADCWKACLKVGGCHMTYGDDFSGGVACLPQSDADCLASAACKTQKSGCTFDPKVMMGKYPGCK